MKGGIDGKGRGISAAAFVAERSAKGLDWARMWKLVRYLSNIDLSEIELERAWFSAVSDLAKYPAGNKKRIFWVKLASDIGDWGIEFSRGNTKGVRDSVDDTIDVLVRCLNESTTYRLVKKG